MATARKQNQNRKKPPYQPVMELRGGEWYFVHGGNIDAKFANARDVTPSQTKKSQSFKNSTGHGFFFHDEDVSGADVIDAIKYAFGGLFK